MIKSFHVESTVEKQKRQWERSVLFININARRIANKVMTAQSCITHEKVQSNK